MTKKRTGEPWMPADEYGAGLPTFTINLIVREVARALPFYTKVMGAAVEYSDPDFAALKLGALQFMLHADHAYDQHPWYPALARGGERGLGAELRLLHVDPDRLQARAKEFGATIVQPAQDKPHGMREIMIADSDGYVWAAGVPLPKKPNS